MELEYVPNEAEEKSGTNMLSDLIKAAMESREKEKEIIANETLEQRLKRISFTPQIRKLLECAVAMKIPEDEILKYAYEGVSIIKLGQFLNSYKTKEKTVA